MMKNITILVINTKDKKVLSECKPYVEILTACHTITQKPPNFREY